MCTRLGNGTVREVIEGQPWWELVQGLYNVTADPRELNDLQKLLPDDVARLKVSSCLLVDSVDYYSAALIIAQ